MSYKWEAMVEDLTVERDRLLKENAVLKKEAARYRLLRKTAYVSSNGWMIGGAYPTQDKWAYNLGKAALEDFDASIDRALNEKTE